MPELNLIAVLVAGIAGFAVGAIWYSPLLFARAWQREVGITPEQLQARSPWRPMIGALLLSIVSAFVFAMFLGPRPGVAFATGAGFAAGLFWVAASYGISYLFEGRSLTLWLINGGYHTLQFTAIGLVLGLLD